LFLQTIRIIRYKILQLKVEKVISFLSLFNIQISTYLRPNIQSAKILGIKSVMHFIQSVYCTILKLKNNAIIPTTKSIKFIAPFESFNSKMLKYV
jgi:hypothetical protein